MGLNCLLLTSDATLLEVIRTGFSATSVELEIRTDAASAIELSARRHLDGFVIDCDDVSGAADVLAVLDVALPRMEREHRRYFRHKVDLPVELLCYTGETFAGKIMNVSEGGLALTHFGPAAVEGVVTVQFGLPSAEPQTFQAKAEVVWNDASAMGLRFLRIEPGSRSCFEARLDSLEAQLQFRESARSSDAASK
jgi:hypothetical protein